MSAKNVSANQHPPEKNATISHELADIILSLTLIAGSAWYVWTASNFPTRGSSWAQAHSFPFGIGYLTILTCLILTLFAVLRIIKKQPLTPVTIGHPWRVAIGMICTITYPLVLPEFGFYLTSALFTGLFGYVAGIRKIIPLLTITLGFLVFTKLVFEQTLGTPLPIGNWL